jgi:hypothetical protein
MWTPTTRQQHSRAVTRYQTDLTGAKWRVIAPHLPKPCAMGRPRREVPRLDTMPIDWQERIDAAIESERATTYEVVAHAIADMTVEHERQIAELKREVEKLIIPPWACSSSATSSTAHIGSVHGAYRSPRSRSDRTPEPTGGAAIVLGELSRALVGRAN